jgi:hypothetical protein
MADLDEALCDASAHLADSCNADAHAAFSSPAVSFSSTPTIRD